MKDWKVVADNLSKAGWSWGCLSAINSKRASNLDYRIVTFAACSPFGPSITSNSTCAPSDRDLKPGD